VRSRTGRTSGSRYTSRKHVWNIKNHGGQLLPVCCRHGEKRSGWTCLDSGSRYKSRKHVWNIKNHCDGDALGPTLSQVKVWVSSEWFQTCRTGFFNESELSQVWLGQSRHFPPLRQRTEVRFLVCPRVETDWADLRQSPHVEKTRMEHQEPRLRPRTRANHRGPDEYSES